MNYLRILWIFIAIGSLFACKENTSPEVAETDIEAELLVKTTPVLRKDMIDTVWIYGDIKLRWEVQLASQFDGRLTEFTSLIGDHITEGQKISTIIPPSREALLQIKDQMDPDMRPLLERQIKSFALYSPIDGIVLDMWHHNGDVVQKGEQIIHIGDLHVLDVHGDLPVRYVSLVKKRKSIMVAFVDFPHAPISLRVDAISGKVDERRQTVAVRCGLNNQLGTFRPGMRVRMYFPGKTHVNTLIIPRSALLEEEGVFSAFILEDGRAAKRRLKVGIFEDDRIEIISGLSENEEVITLKAYSLTDGMKVIVE